MAQQATQVASPDKEGVRSAVERIAAVAAGARVQQTKRIQSPDAQAMVARVRPAAVNPRTRAGIE